jgi:hypothetical protein
MIKISCYKTTQEKLSRAFCNLAEKCYHSAIKIFVYTNSKEQAFELDTVYGYILGNNLSRMELYTIHGRKNNPF